MQIGEINSNKLCWSQARREKWFEIHMRLTIAASCWNTYVPAGIIIYHTLQHSFEDEAIALQWLSIGIVTFEGGDDFEFDGDEEMSLPREIEAVVFWCLKG